VRKRALRITSGLGGVVAILAITPSVGFAQEYVPTTADVLNNIWVVIAGVLVFFMQAGFALLEAGLTRAKNVVNIFAKNIADAIIGVLAFFAVGYAIAFGSDTNNFIGTEGFFLSGLDVFGIGAADELSVATVFFFQAVFAATAVTIASGAMAERTKFSAYLIFSTVMCAFIYPVVVHWTWGGGLIAQIDYDGAVYSDFAGSGIVHMTGGIAALMGAYFLGPRLGKYGEDGKPRAIPGHNLAFATLGVFILWVGWFGFNAGSELLADFEVPRLAMNTMLAAAGGGLATTITIWAVAGKPDLAMIGNGVLAGLVSITAPVGTVNAGMAVVIGAVGGVIVVFSVLFFDRIKIDDPVGAISVHGVCGAWGVISVGLFAQYPDAFVNGALGDDYTASGLFYGGGINQLLVQLTMIAIIGAWVAITTGILFAVLKATVGLRVSEEEEMTGLDVLEHGVQGYAPDMAASR
jgi:Amt family ammonium transporter